MLTATLLVLAIRQTNPAVPEERAQQYAEWVLADAEQHELDPWIYAAIVHQETRWTSGVVRHEHDGTCSVGLGQINVPCNSPKLQLLRSAHENLKQMGVFLDRIRLTCRSSCAELGWLRAYNPGSRDYFNAVCARVKAYHAEDAQSPLFRLQGDVHTSWVLREERNRAGRECWLDSWDDTARGFVAP